jgi:hypothetical protein
MRRWLLVAGGVLAVLAGGGTWRLWMGMAVH